MVHSPAEVHDWIAQSLIPGGGVWVAVLGVQVVAMMAVSSEGAERWIEQLYVQPGCTGQGIGAQLLGMAHRVLMPPVRLYTFQANDGARRFYERHGYRVLCYSDGAGNEERCADVLYEWRGDAPAAMPDPPGTESS